ncbi:MAG: hypothetical protein ACYS7Y_33500 [Planctomycetota bacterium]|jgi:hypothetical protein
MSEPIYDDNIYAVWGNHTDRRFFLGIATGTIADITAYFDDRKAYGLDVEPVSVNRIPDGYAEQRAPLLKRKVAVEAELRKLNAQLDAPWNPTR